jgi:hypothetical protein
MAKDYGTAYVPAADKTVTMRECDLCGSVYAAGAIGHSPAGDATDTFRHKNALPTGK